MARKAAFRNEEMDVRIPFQRPSKRVKNTNEARDKVFGIHS